ncbi:RNA polymerase sigma factor [Chitinophaga sp. S165]|uniref:RNA polymerase sigma factor n=1 Tax=Chitinophaga sp. S165 TaxID=2135462 RepID=UPI000D718D50|nr:sigma-70 family RNA polymerase sigma factor [Chitinophaga sp. S165]PWV55556.1 RNA polymerase sigma factor (sigma-70 family) [Chitinophaga sp. S165]
MENTEEATLLDQLNQGDELEQTKAYTVIYEKYKRNVEMYLQVFGTSPQDAQDIAHDALTQLWINRGQLPIMTSLQGYLNVTARNRSINAIKKQQKMEKREVIHEERLDHCTVNEQAIRDQLNYYLHKANARWSELEESVFMDARIYEEKHRDIATKHDLPLVRVKNILAKCAKSLAKFKRNNHEPNQ